jgi:D-alanine-D-alanine ligase-like ATP-grasp enzyme
MQTENKNPFKRQLWISSEIPFVKSGVMNAANALVEMFMRRIFALLRLPQVFVVLDCQDP